MESGITLPVGRGISYICLAAVAWGTGGIAAAVLYRTSGLGPVAVSFWRVACGVAVLYGSLGWLRRRARNTGVGPTEPARPRATPAVVLATGVGLAIYQAAYYEGVHASGVAVATVVTLGASPILIALAARFSLGERLGRVGVLAVGCAVLGLVLLVAGGIGVAGRASAGAEVTLAGVLWSLFSAAGYAVVTVLNRRVGGDPVSTTISGFVVAGLCLLPLALAEGAWPSRVDVQTFAMIAYLGAVPTALAYGMFFAGLAVVRATTVSVLTLMEPLTATTIAVMALGEHLTIPVAAGGVVLLGAVVLLARAER